MLIQPSKPKSQCLLHKMPKFISFIKKSREIQEASCVDIYYLHRLRYFKRFFTGCVLLLDRLFPAQQTIECFLMTGLHYSTVKLSMRKSHFFKKFQRWRTERTIPIEL